jgi:Na+/melibiose symporter-like transporter
LRNDTARAGFQFGLWQCAGKFSAGLAVLLALGLLITAGGREAIMPGSAAGATELILVTVGLLPPFAKLMAVTQIWSLPLDAAKQKELQDRLQARRAGTSQQKAPEQREKATG